MNRLSHYYSGVTGGAMRLSTLARHILAGLALAALVLPARAYSGEVRITYHFEAPRIERTVDGFARAIFEGTVQAGKLGEPSYPFRGCRILLPPGQSVTSVTFERGGWKTVSGSHRLYPAQAPVPSAEPAKPGERFLYNAAAYGIDSWVYPPESTFSTHYMRGHAIADGCLSPVGFRPASGEVGYFSDVTVTIETAESKEAREALNLLRTDQETNERLSALVDNPVSIPLYGSIAAPLGDIVQNFEYLIITREALRSSFMPLKEFYDRRGMRTRIMTVEEIASGYAGRDTTEKIRSAIKARYMNSDITHVLLGGDADGPSYAAKVVPARGLYGEVQSSTLYVDDNIPADIYFSNLDGDWNADGDADWGEPGEEDPYAEVAVGRASVDDASEVATFVAKTMMYQDRPVASQVRRSLMLGEKLYDDPLTYGEDELEQLIGTCTEHGFATTGFPTDYAYTKVYDRAGTWSGADALSAINAGTNWVNHAGHSNWVYVMRLGIAYATDVHFTNDGVTANFPIINSNGCYAASFDNRTTTASLYESFDCIAEEMLTINHGAVAFLGNSRYGWFTEGTTNGPSHHFEREFFDAIFTEGYHTLGAALARSKDETVPFLDLPEEYEPGAHRWCFYTLNLLGDPALDGWTDTPESLVVTHAAQMSRGDVALSLETGVPGAVACLYRNGLVYGRGVADSSGHIELVRYRALPDSVTSIELDIYAHDHYVHRDTLSVTETTDSGAPIPAVVLEQNFPNPFNPATVIRFSLARESVVELRVYDASGTLVDRLASGRLPRGTHEISWRPSKLASGVYFYVLRAGGVEITRKAVLLR
jgi:hypothetical protein